MLLFQMFFHERLRISLRLMPVAIAKIIIGRMVPYRDHLVATRSLLKFSILEPSLTSLPWQLETNPVEGIFTQRQIPSDPATSKRLCKGENSRLSVVALMLFRRSSR